jgi:hypothetical protein
MAQRKAISKKLRFEVFKRDAFTCQYCGKSAPSVVLEIDHINPVKSSGDNDIMNLITSCFDCNRGKGARKLSDKEVLNKQMEELKRLNETREQMKEMLRWKQELVNLADEQINVIEGVLEDYETELTDLGKSNFKKWIEKYGFSEVYESLLLSISQYQSESISKAVSYTPRICANRVKQKNDPLLHKKNTLKYIIKTRHLRSFVEYDRFNELFEWIDGEEPVLDIIIEMANKSVSYRDFWNKVEKYKENI